jgi:hypothetical protein
MQECSGTRRLVKREMNEREKFLLSNYAMEIDNPLTQEIIVSNPTHDRNIYVFSLGRRLSVSSQTVCSSSDYRVQRIYSFFSTEYLQVRSGASRQSGSLGNLSCKKIASIRRSARWKRR